VVSRQNADIVDTVHLRDVAMATIFCFLHNGVHIDAAWRVRLNRPCAAPMRPYVKLLCYWLGRIAVLRTQTRPIVTDRVAWRVGRSVCHTSEPCKNGCTDRDAIWVEHSGGPREACIR